MSSKKYMYKLPSHAYIRPLVAEDLDQCVELEIAGFQPDQRASREKIAYRLRVCPELSAGIFIREIEDEECYYNPTFSKLEAYMLDDLNIESEEVARATAEVEKFTVSLRAAEKELIDKAKKEFGALHPLNDRDARLRISATRRILNGKDGKNIKAEYKLKASDACAKKKAAIKNFREKVEVQRRILEEENESSTQPEGGKKDENEKKSNNDLNGDEKNEDEDENAVFEFEKYGKYQPVKSSRVKETLIGHIIATKTVDSTINDLTMEIPKLDKYGRKDASEPKHRGHGDDGTYIAIHSVVVSPKYQGSGIGTLMLTDYIQRMGTVSAGRALILIAVEKNVPFYQSLGFNDDGISECKYADTEWHNLSKSLGEEWETYAD